LAVGFYRERVLPHLLDHACRTPELASWRREVTDGLAGRILEIGFGSGLNLEHYPAGVEAVLAVEPAATARRLAARREARAGVPVEHVGLNGEKLELEDASVDGALSTFTLCTIPDVERALAELRRVIRPGGTFHFLEHGLAPAAGVVAWQRRLEPLQKRLAGGCHLTRDIPELVRGAGFEIERLEQRYAEGPRPWGWFTAGAARNP
jgi:SAM-dependent methyltransferase